MWDFLEMLTQNWISVEYRNLKSYIRFRVPNSIDLDFIHW